MGSSPTTGTTSEQSPLCSDVFLCLWQKRCHPPAPLLLLSKSNPLRWASIWFWAETWRHWHLYCCDISSPYSVRSTGFLFSPCQLNQRPLGVGGAYNRPLPGGQAERRLSRWFESSHSAHRSILWDTPIFEIKLFYDSCTETCSFLLISPYL